MIQDIINNITSAEMEAEEIVKIASQQAKDTRLVAEVKVESLNKTSAAECKEAVKLMQSNAEVVAVKKTEMRIREGKKEADKFIVDCQKKTDKAVDFIVGRLVEKYGNR
ncbi:MAG: hypothetical protein RR357_03455 [Clostridia bacterium]